MKCTVRRPRSRWVGPPVSAPKSELSRSPSGRQRHYGAVELVGAGDQVNVNDVVEVVENKQQQQETSQRHPVLVQVLSMWEDTFTGVFKFRARWLIQALDLPADALPRLRMTRQASAADRSATGSKTHSGNDEDEVDEVFLTRRVKDLEVRSIVKPIILRVGTSATAEVSTERKAKMGPRLTHAFCEASGDFNPLEGTDPILKRARVRQAHAVALASRADQENEAAKSGKPIVKSNGWLLPKRGAFARGGGRTAAHEKGGGGEFVASSSSSRLSSSSPSIDIEEASDDSGVEEPRNSEVGEWKEGEEGEDDDATDTDSASPRNSKPTLSVDGGFTQRKSARQRKSQPPPTSDVEVEDCGEAKPEAKPCPPAPTAASTPAPTFQRRRRVPLKTRQGLLPPRPRRLAMPPTAEEPLIAHMCEAPPLATAKSSVAMKVVRPAKTRVSLGLRPKPSLALPRSASMGDVVKATPPLSNSAKRKRSGANMSTQGATRSDYPPLRTLVGKNYQTDIPDLLSAEERKQPHTGTRAKMVWRSVHDWDQHSRGMLASYLHAAKGIVEAKQARPGVAVHVRLGGIKKCSGTETDNTEIASSYAVWAISSGREACGLIRVACSEMAQTDIPRSAIQRVQSQEQALAALVKARCVLDSYEPALQMLAEDHGSPESIEPWSIKQVRTLEEALVKEYDPSRRLHAWARPGMEMDREEFIDLAKVSNDVPGKTPTQVLSFYYKYLATAEPLTDIVYGPEAANARKQETISPVSSTPKADAVPSGNEGLAREYTNTIKPKTPARQVSPGLCQASPANRSGNVSEPTLKPQPRVVGLSAPNAPDSVLAMTRSSAAPAGESVQKIIRDLSRPSCYAAGSAPRANYASHLPAVPKHATIKVTSGDDGGSAEAYRVTVTGPADSDRGTSKGAEKQGDDGGGQGVARKFLAQQNQCAVREGAVSRTFPPLPPDTEVLEVEDSDDADGGGATRGTPLLTSSGTAGGGRPTIPSDMEVAAQHIDSMGPAGLLWMARKMRRQATPAVEAVCRPSGVQSMALRSAPRNSDSIERQRTGGSDGVRYAYRSSALGRPGTQKDPRWEDPPLSHSTWHEEHVRRFDDPPNNRQVERGDIPSSGLSGPGYGRRRTVHVGTEPVPRDDTFGSMTSCWRLLERAQAYMDKDQLEYMRGLILTHVRKPMSRDQLLERAESCLQGQGKIFAAFVKMFDRIDQPPQVPLYPTKRALLARPQSASYSVRRMPDADADPVHTRHHGLPPSHIPPPRTFKAQGGGSYSVCPIKDGGERGVFTNTPSQPYSRARIPLSGREELRRSIHPYDHNGVGGWRASDAGSTDRDVPVGIRDRPPPRRLSPGPQPSNLDVHPARYADSRPGTGHGGGNVWSQQPPGEWKTDLCPSALAAAVPSAPDGMARSGIRGPAWN